MAPSPTDRSQEQLAREIDNTAREAFTSYCPLYEHMARSMARDPELLTLAARVRPGQAAALIVLDTVHYLLLRGEKHPLGRFYISLTEHPAVPEDAPSAFADFCRQYRAELERLLPTRLVQTNEVRRCALLLPALTLAAREGGGAPLALVALGASAGLNLLIDKYGYDYGEGRRCGEPGSPLQLACELRGGLSPPLPAEMPRVAGRVGVDLNPLDLRDNDNLTWLLGQIWPNDAYRERAERLRLAAEFQRREPPRLIAGDIMQTLPEIVAGAPPEQQLCLLHSFTVYELPAEVRRQLSAVIIGCAAKRPLASVGLEWDSHHRSWLDVAWYRPGRPMEARRLAQCQAHGQWMEWLLAPGETAGRGKA